MTRPLRLLAALPVAAAVAALTWHSIPSQAASGDWTPVWSDQFNGPAGQRLDPTSWTPQIGTSYPGGAPNWGTGEVETDTDSPANASTDGAGHAAIRAIREADGHWTSARLETVRTDFQPPPGGVLKVEVSARQPDVSGAEAAGIWPALWMLGAPARGVGATNWPSIGEADILETAGGHDSNWGTFHCGTWGGVCNEPDGKSSGERSAASLGLSSFKTTFHTYAIEWDQSTSPQEMRWYIDGVNYHTVRATDMPADVWTAATNHGYFLVMDIAMGGGLADKAGGGPTAATKSGVPLLVDYFSVSSKAGSGGTPTPTPTTSTSTGAPTSATSSSTTPGSIPTVTMTSTVTLTTTVTVCPPISPTTSPTSPTSTSPTSPPSAGPGTPSNLRLAGQTSSSLTLAWDGTAGASYDVLRSGVRIATVTGTTFTDIGLMRNTPYIYSIRGMTTTPQQTFTITG
ncbi:MAG: family 16 glycosylhydrolase [Lapillicoccus sp.]